MHHLPAHHPPLGLQSSGIPATDACGRATKCSVVHRNWMVLPVCGPIHQGISHLVAQPFLAVLFVVPLPNELEGAPPFEVCANSAPSRAFCGMNGGLLRSNATNSPLFVLLCVLCSPPLTLWWTLSFLFFSFLFSPLPFDPTPQILFLLLCALRVEIFSGVLLFNC